VVTGVSGLGSVALVTVDAVLTVLRSTRRGPLSLVTVAAVWTTARALARTVGRPVCWAGPGCWPSSRSPRSGRLMWLGWARVHLPTLGDFSYDSAVP
jgi:hypothetical protein